MRKWRSLSCLFLLILVATLTTGCRVQYEALTIHHVPPVIWEQMVAAQKQGGAFVFRPDDHEIDSYYLLFSPGEGPNPGPTGPIGPAVRLQRYAYDAQTKTITVTINHYIPQTGSSQQIEGNHSESWYLVLRFTGQMKNFRVITSEGLEIPVVTK